MLMAMFFSVGLVFAEDASTETKQSDNSSYSWVEKKILENIPSAYIQHKDGIVVSPTKNDVDDAIKFGASDKDDSAVMYAYLMRGPSEFWNQTEVYVYVRTPLYLVADHARKEAREYREVDTSFVEFCKTLNVAQVSLVQQIANKLRVHAYKAKLVLLRDGKRVETVLKVQTIKGRNPYAPKLSPELEALATNLANQSQQLKEQMMALYKANGMSEEQLKVMFGSSVSSVQSTSALPSEVPVLETDGIFAISELKKPGKYEIVFRTPPSSNIFVSGDKEIRFPVSFDKFK